MFANARTGQTYCFKKNIIELRENEIIFIYINNHTRRTFWNPKVNTKLRKPKFLASGFSSARNKGRNARNAKCAVCSLHSQHIASYLLTGSSVAYLIAHAWRQVDMQIKLYWTRVNVMAAKLNLPFAEKPIHDKQYPVL